MRPLSDHRLNRHHLFIILFDWLQHGGTTTFLCSFLLPSATRTQTRLRSGGYLYQNILPKQLIKHNIYTNPARPVPTGTDDSSYARVEVSFFFQKFTLCHICSESFNTHCPPRQTEATTLDQRRPTLTALAAPKKSSKPPTQLASFSLQDG